MLTYSRLTCALFAIVLLFTAVSVSNAASISVSGSCDLASAITAANTDSSSGGCPAGSGADTIHLSSNITLSAELPNITSTITIMGDRFGISGGSQYRIFYVEAAGNLTLNQLTLAHGQKWEARTAQNGIFLNGGAIYSEGGLTVERSTFASNRGGVGGAIFVQGSNSLLNVVNSTFYNNNSSYGGALYANGGITYITNSTFKGNNGESANAVGTIGGWSGTVILRNSIIVDSLGKDCLTELGVVTTHTYIEDGSCFSDYSSVDGPIALGNLTGAPAYYPLLAGSPAIGAGAMWLCPNTDQPGGARPLPANTPCDLGAFEYHQPLPRSEHAISSVSSAPTPVATTNVTARTAVPTQIPPTATAIPSATATDTDEPPPVDSRSISNLQLSSDKPGVITASWSIPFEEPKDYRVSWAPVGENFKTYSDLSANAFPDISTINISGLAQGGRYKVMVRARYAGNSGPFSTPVEVIVSAQPTSTQTSVPPTQTSVPPTQTSVPPTQTSVPPTETPLPPTNTSVPLTQTPLPTNTSAPLGPREIGSVSLANDAPGAISVSWTIPAESPVDYRVSWAPVGENFRTWTDTSFNAFPESNSHSISQLNQGQRYKVIVRARYNGSSGPFTEPVEFTVAQ